ncbi:MAG: hypothetical protein JXR88_12975 [Clostridia bacterium]|nr:hypothetical protein [Clostridia bacterium]
MKKELAAHVITKFKREATTWRFLFENKIEKNTLLEAVNQKQFYSMVFDQVSQEDYSCKGSVEGLNVIAMYLTNQSLEQDFIGLAYQYTLSKAFPDAVTEDFSKYSEKVYVLFLKYMEVINDFQKESQDGTYLSTYPLELLSEDELRALDQPEEYKIFKEAFDAQNIYTMMKLNYEVTGHSTIEHILGVHYLAMHLGRSLKERGLPVDLGRVSGAAAGHDIGKFGCRPEENHKIAYYHYYYTDMWFSNLNLTYIKNVAVYHSTWDLEIESLSIESLILIYADFCVKRSKEKPGKFAMKFLTVDEAFQVILSKLDNVNDQKRNRYKKVYQKLKNFSEFMISLGIETTIENYISEPLLPPQNKDITDYFSALDCGKKVVDHLKYIAIDKSVRMMHKLRHAEALNAIIQEALAEKDIYFFRRYIFIFEEFCIYFTPHQKMITLQFLLGYIMHIEEDVRKDSSRLIGKLLALYDENYTKELPERAQVTYTVETKYQKLKSLLDDFLLSETRLTSVKKNRQVYSYLEIIRTLYFYVDDYFKSKVTNLLMSYFDDEIAIYGMKFLIQVIGEMDEKVLAANEESSIIQFLIRCLNESEELRLLAISQLRKYLLKSPQVKDKLLEHEMILNNYFKLNRSLPEKFLGFEIYQLFDPNAMRMPIENNSEMFLSNLKAATYKTVKQAQIEMLYVNSLTQTPEAQFYTAMHYCNLIKVSEFEVVRNLAGKFLVDLFPNLSTAQKNDIVIELIRALEIEGYGFTQYIPQYLGQLIPTLPEKEYFEIVQDVTFKISNAGAHVRILLLDTLGVMISAILKDDLSYDLNPLLGLIFKGFYSGHKLVTQIALHVLSKKILGNNEIHLEKRYKIFKIVYRKLNNFLLDEHRYSELDLLNFSVAMHYIYHFITDYSFYYGEMMFEKPRDIAFYSGTFDPFSLGQKEAAMDAVSLGLDVYVAISEFHWKRRTQPSLIRKQIAEMTIGDQFYLYTFPQNLPIHLKRKEDLNQLKRLFEDKKIYLIIGEDALLHDSIYQQEDHPVYEWPHIIYKRSNFNYAEEDKAIIESRIQHIAGGALIRTLKEEFETIDVDQIRRNIDNNWDGFNVIDDLATRFINSRNIYKNEPQFKSIVPITPIRLELQKLKDEKNLEALCENFGMNYNYLTYLQGRNPLDLNQEPLPERYILKIMHETEQKIVALSIFAMAEPKNLFDEIKCLDILEEIANKKLNKILIIDYVLMKPTHDIHALDQIILTETLMISISKGYQYGVVKWLNQQDVSPDIHGVLLRSGFKEYECHYTKQQLFGVDMSSPVVLNLDGTTRMKSAYRQNDEIREQIKLVRSDLQHAIVNLYPGCLVLSFDRSMLYNHLIRLITSQNDVSIHHGTSLGSHMCVPYGDIFKRWLLPNTITKAFHTERYYKPTLEEYDVKAYPGYLSIENQVKVLKAFDLPIILVDDILDKGKRLEAFQVPLQESGVTISQVVVGILSERGKKKFNDKKIAVKGAYYIPNIKVWFNEADLYPFIGGDSVERPSNVSQYGLISANLMLPFSYPKYIKGVDRSKLYHLSLICLENAIDILHTIEAIYLQINRRALTLDGLGEVMITPRIPDNGAHIQYDVFQTPSTLLENDLERLKKMKQAFFN